MLLQTPLNLGEFNCFFLFNSHNGLLIRQFPRQHNTDRDQSKRMFGPWGTELVNFLSATGNI